MRVPTAKTVGHAGHGQSPAVATAQSVSAMHESWVCSTIVSRNTGESPRERGHCCRHARLCGSSKSKQPGPQVGNSSQPGLSLIAGAGRGVATGVGTTTVQPIVSANTPTQVSTKAWARRRDGIALQDSCAANAGDEHRDGAVYGASARGWPRDLYGGFSIAAYVRRAMRDTLSR